ncbi:Aste57867_7532 [Aphanomyces stellatus]|uniref:Aste57867_7532 protein n=1 Tax=Aphanomyces stellatus TaxID=120398 RepID=A0A485KIG1_9STRA|nr:hypothetical protein As57867_007506 [Aphanomyces stellatus]VFT84441.1 Aste57867_7532 [Aphanomyces stellatus]
MARNLADGFGFDVPLGHGNSGDRHPHLISIQNPFGEKDTPCDSKKNLHACPRLSFNLDTSAVAFARRLTSLSSLLLEYCHHRLGASCATRFLLVDFVKSKNRAESDARIEDILRRGLSFSVDGPVYRVLGLSNSQLRQAGFLFCCDEEADRLVQDHFLPDPQTLARKPPPKRVKHVGLLFTSCSKIAHLPPGTQVVTTDDVERHGFCFTDGCGLMSPRLAHSLAKQLKLKPCPNVWQVRYCGHGGIWKGVLVVDYSAANGASELTFRPSQLKLSTLDTAREPSAADLFLRDKLGIVGTNMRSKPANMNVQLVTLLSVHIPRQVFLDLHDAWRQIKPQKHDKVSCPESRFLYGVAIPTLGIPEGHCMVSYRDKGGVVHWVTGDVLVCRVPSYHVGDVRVLTAIAPPPTSHVAKNLADVVVFSTDGARPDADKMSGGDLDGDQFTVIFNPEFVAHADAFRRELPMTTTNGAKTGTKPEDWISYAARWDQTLLAALDMAFQQFAAMEGPASATCKEIAGLFGSAVDQVACDVDRILDLCNRARAAYSAWKMTLPVLPVWLELQTRGKAYPTLVLTDEVLPQRFEQGQARHLVESLAAEFGAKFGLGEFEAMTAAVRDVQAQLEDIKSMAVRQDKTLKEFEYKGKRLAQLETEGHHAIREAKANADATETFVARCLESIALATMDKCSAEEAILEMKDWIDHARRGSKHRALIDNIADQVVCLSDVLAEWNLALTHDNTFWTWFISSETIKKDEERASRCAALVEDICRTICHKTHEFPLEEDALKLTNAIDATVSLKQAREAVATMHTKLVNQVSATSSKIATIKSEAARQGRALSEKFPLDRHWQFHALTCATEALESMIARDGIANRHVAAAGKRERDRLTSMLPILKVRARVREALTTHSVVVLTAQTGSGKSTQTPQYLSDDFFAFGGDNRPGRVVCTQPRRVAATGIATRVASEFGGDVGEFVGYHIGRSRVHANGTQELEENRRWSKTTCIKFVTDGVLLNELQRDANASAYDVVVLDEVHERGKDTDVIMVLLRRALQVAGSKLKLVLMSASIDAVAFQEYFKLCGIACCEIGCEGFTYPVQHTFGPPMETWPNKSPKLYAIVQNAIDVLETHIVGSGTSGDVLIFLPSQQAITDCCRQVADRFRNHKDEDIHVFELLASTPQAQQDKALKPCVPRPGTKKTLARKIICCTNVAETSLTIHGVVFVIDSGLAKMKSYDNILRVEALTDQVISMASAKQRAGRAGRTQPGHSFRLYSASCLKSPYDPPKIAHEPIAELLLYTWTTGLHDVSLLMNPPHPTAVRAATSFLVSLGFADPVTRTITLDGRIAGEFMQEFPLPSIRMILEGHRHGIGLECLYLAAAIAKGHEVFESDEQFDLVAEFVDEWGDFFTHYNVVKQWMNQPANKRKKWAAAKNLNASALAEVQRLVDYSYRKLLRRKLVGPVDESLSVPDVRRRLRRALLAGYFVNLAVLHDVNHMEAGYSLLCGFNDVESVDDDSLTLLKAHICNRNSMMNALGNEVRNTWVCYSTVRRAGNGCHFMNLVNRVNIKDLLEVVDPDCLRYYLNTLNLTPFDLKDVDNTGRPYFIVEKNVPHVGETVLNIFRSDDKLKLAVRAPANAATFLDIDCACVRVYGSVSEVTAALSIIQEAVASAQELAFADEVLTQTIPLDGGVDSVEFGPGFSFDKGVLDYCAPSQRTLVVNRFYSYRDDAKERFEQQLYADFPQLNGRGLVVNTETVARSTMAFVKFTRVVPLQVVANISNILEAPERFYEFGFFKRNIELPPFVTLDLYPSLVDEAAMFGVKVKEKSRRVTIHGKYDSKLLFQKHIKRSGLLRPVMHRVTFPNIGDHASNVAELVKSKVNEHGQRVHVTAETDGPNDVVLAVYGDKLAQKIAVDWVDSTACRQQMKKWASETVIVARTYRLERGECSTISKNHLNEWRKLFHGKLASIHLHRAFSNRRELNAYLQVESISADAFGAFERQFDGDMNRRPVEYGHAFTGLPCSKCSSFGGAKIRLGICGCVTCQACLQEQILHAPKLPIGCVNAEQCHGILLPAVDVKPHVTKTKLSWLCKRVFEAALPKSDWVDVYGPEDISFDY